MRKLGDPIGGTVLHVARDNLSENVLSDIGGPHGGVNPYVAQDTPSGQAGTPSKALTVIAKAFRFAPAVLDLKAGQKVTFEFENQDEADHNIVLKKERSKRSSSAAARKRSSTGRRHRKPARSNSFAPTTAVWR